MSLLTTQPSLPKNGHAWLFSNAEMSDVILEFQVDPEDDEGRRLGRGGAGLVSYCAPLFSGREGRRACCLPPAADRELREC